MTPFCPRPLYPLAIMEQPSEPNNAAMHNVQRRRGSVGMSQLFENIVSTSNCTFDMVVQWLEPLRGWGLKAETQADTRQSTERKWIGYENVS